VALTDGKAASGIQALFTGRLLFTQSSLTSPNDVFIIRDLKRFEDEISQSDIPLTFKGKAEQITRFTEADLKEKSLSEGEEFWFKGAEHKNVHGWALKPRGWESGQKRKYPVLLLIHGGRIMVFCCAAHGQTDYVDYVRTPGSLGGSMVESMES
jgi:dipeptidyl aminopeptidase/acylaminoacyl peptidase